MISRLRHGGALLTAGLLLADCRAPTDILLQLGTDVDCRDVTETAIAAGTPDDLADRAFTTSTTACDADTGRIGSIALVPRSAADAEVAVQVVMGISKSARQCARDGYKGGCVVARRALRFRPQHALDLPIQLEASCRDIPCTNGETCRGGRCVPALLPDPTRCTDPAGCGAAAGGHGGVAGAPANMGGEAPTSGGGTGGQSGNGAVPPIGDAGSGGGSDECADSLNGTFALKLSLRATWPPGTYIEGGSGTFLFWMRLSGVHDGDRIGGELTECGRQGPDLRSAAVDATYQLAYPDSLFDAAPPLLRPVPVLLQVGDGRPGALLTASSIALVLGATLSDPIQDLWPASAADLTPVDEDADGKPGVTALYRQGVGYDYPRAGPLLGSERVELPYLASRLVFSLDGELTTCTSSSGEATVSVLNTRMFGCRLESAARDCDSEEAAFLDRNAVQYRPVAATYELTKVPDGASCAEIRSSL